MKTLIAYRTMPSPLGDMLIVAAGNALRGIYFAGQKYEPAVGTEWNDDPERPVLRAAASQLDEYFAGARTRFEIPLDPSGTAFQRAVWNAIAAVPWGSTIS